ncbi:hypothetical protein GCM10017083_22730 [Thalassobaculum fulvum]|uniref:Uncharacterized protein n=1 Tax=Thalassobaculum fulvum TaxID=1633335 RepID=A0A918XSB3_9PROT|nr:DUF6615 family protein [Thalassobaculum fulvum]GHD49866.1 hypothetical protein GCM10017083_22730 [Thalassobaculum fulvum]
MSVAPIFKSPCDLATRLPAMIAEFLDIEQHLKRRFREDSITDILIASLLSLPGNQVVVMTPPEATTGGDFDIIVVEPTSSNAVQFRIQAKRLTPHHHNWPIGSYTELAHPHNSGVQSQKLVGNLGRELLPTIPLYAFYNPAHVCTASGGTVSGIELASGWEVREYIKAIVRVKPKRLPLKRIGALQPLFFPLATILCPPQQQSDDTHFPLPSVSRAAVEEAIEKRSGFPTYTRTLDVETEAQQRTLPSSPRAPVDTHAQQRHGGHDRDSGETRLPAIIRTAIERRDERIIKVKARRPRILLISEPKEK